MANSNFEQRQIARKNKRRLHQKAINTLMHKVGGRHSSKWDNIRYSIRKAYYLQMSNQFHMKYKRLIGLGRIDQALTLKRKWGIV